MLVRGDEPLDLTFERVLAQAPADVQARARGLPYRLGLTHRPQGGWGDFASLEPICDLPLFVLDVLPTADEEEVARFRFAHRVGGFHGLLVDRVTDGQAVADAGLRRVRAWLRRARVDALAAATGRRPEAVQAVTSAERSFREATVLERHTREVGRLTPGAYVRIVTGKTAWLAVPTAAMLRQRAPEMVAPFGRAFALFMLGLQTLDDGLDAAEDQALFGVTVPTLLGVSPDVMRAAARIVTERSTDTLRGAGLHRFARWSEARAHELRSATSLLSALGGLSLGERLAA